MRNGPIAKPNFWMALSTCCGVQPFQQETALTTILLDRGR